LCILYVDAEQANEDQLKRLIRPEINTSVNNILVPANDQLHLQDIIARIDQVLTSTTKN
jgi:hypothetical protein